MAIPVAVADPTHAVVPLEGLPVERRPAAERDTDEANDHCHSTGNSPAGG
jgi:hypothetical protein